MKVLLCGLGSIGTRHLKNLHAVAARKGVPVQAYALRSSARALPAGTKALLAGEFCTLPQGAQFDAAFLTNPTSLHYGTLCALRSKAGALFIEKPIFDAPGKNLPCPGPESLCGGPHELVRRDAGPEAPFAAAEAVFGAGDLLVLPAGLAARCGLPHRVFRTQGHGRRRGH
mgnify:CR=1 FL=1